MFNDFTSSTCINAQWNCNPASSLELRDYPNANDIKTRCSAVDNLEFTTCESVEPTTCKVCHFIVGTNILLRTSCRICILKNQLHQQFVIQDVNVKLVMFWTLPPTHAYHQQNVHVITGVEVMQKMPLCKVIAIFGN